MKRSLLALMLLMGTNLHAECEHKSREKECTTCASTPISKPTTIKKPGTYCLTNDISGPITIESHDVTLDLNSFVVDGKSGPYGIYSHGFNNITIKNGSVTNVGEQAIGISFTNGFVLENIQVYNSNRAIALMTSKNSEIRSLYAYNLVNTIGPIVLIDNCNTVRLFDVQASNNTKALIRLAPGSIHLDPTVSAVISIPFVSNASSIGIISVNNSKNVILTNCSANANTRLSDVALMAPFAALISKNISFINCQANGNTTPDSVTDTQGFAGFYVTSCFDVSIEGCEANQNSVVFSESFLSGIYIIGTENATVSNSSACENTGGMVGYGAYVLGTFTAFADEAILCRDIKIVNCVANDNVSNDFIVGFFLGGKVALPPAPPLLTYSEDCAIIGCQADRNSATHGFGIVLQNARRCEVIQCRTNLNSTTGVLAGTAIGDLNADTACINQFCTISESKALENGVNGFEIGDGINVINNGFLLESNIASNNGNIGFLHSPATLTSRYLSNFAQDNGTNYSITGGTIQLFSLNAAGIYTLVSGDPTLTHLTNIEAIP